MEGTAHSLAMSRVTVASQWATETPKPNTDEASVATTQSCQTPQVSASSSGHTERNSKSSARTLSGGLLVRPCGPIEIIHGVEARESWSAKTGKPTASAQDGSHLVACESCPPLKQRQHARKKELELALVRCEVSSRI